MKPLKVNSCVMHFILTEPACW